MPESKNNSSTKDLKQENDILRKELHTSKKEIKNLHQRLVVLENNNVREVKTEGSSILDTLPESKSDNKSELKLDSDDDYVQSWQVLGHHFSEVIRRHHEVLAEKDRQIKELQESRCNGELPKYSSKKFVKRESSTSNSDTDRGKCRRFTTELPKYPLKNSMKGESSTKNSDTDRGKMDNVVQFYQKLVKDINEVGPSECECNCKSVIEERGMTSSGETLREHFDEVMRRHKQQLLEKDFQIQELQEALECVMGGNTHDPQPTRKTRQLMPGSATPASQRFVHTLQPHYTTNYYDDHSDVEDYDTPDEDEGSPSADTFVVIDKCQRLESIANLERLRQNLIKRLETEEKLDQLYWKKELSRYQELCDQGGFDPNSADYKDFELFKTTRFDLLKALKHVKEASESEPEWYVMPHLPQRDSANVVTHPEFDDVIPNSSSGPTRVSFIEEVKIKTLHTTYEKK